jgi:NADH dehydrogenase
MGPGTSVTEGTARPRIVIVGAGFGGLFAARGLAGANAEVVLVDAHNYHLFQPLLYQVATAGLAPSDIAWPIRSIVTRQRNTSVLLAEVTGVDLAARQLQLADGTLDFDYLVLATGAQHAYFGHDDWRDLAPGLKSIDDATAMRRRLLLAFEQAENCADPAERERLLRFVIVGAGPTGVELAGALAELAHHTLAKDFRRIDPRSARVVLVEAGPRVLPTFSAPMSAYARRALERLGVEVRVNVPVTACDASGVTLGPGDGAGDSAGDSAVGAAGAGAGPRGERLAAASIIWQPGSPHRRRAGGSAPRPIARGAWPSMPTCRCPALKLST